MQDELEQLAQALAASQFELEMKGFTPEQISAARKWVVARSQGIAKDMPDDLQDPVFIATVKTQSQYMERWIESQIQAAEPIEDKPV